MNLRVFGEWFHIQANEEQEHAMKFAKYLIDQGADVKLQALPEPKTKFASVQEICQGAVDHELLITKNINDLVDLARAEKDHATEAFLHWFVGEQVEEVASVKELLEMVKLAQTAGMSSQEFRRQFEHLVADEPPPLELLVPGPEEPAAARPAGEVSGKRSR